MSCRYCDNPTEDSEYCSEVCSQKDLDEREKHNLQFYKKNFNYEDQVFEFLYKRKEIIYIRGVGYVRVYDNPDPSVCLECNKKLQERCLSCRAIIWNYDERGVKCTAKCKKCD